MVVCGLCWLIRSDLSVFWSIFVVLVCFYYVWSELDLHMRGRRDHDPWVIGCNKKVTKEKKRAEKRKEGKYRPLTFSGQGAFQ